VKGQIVKRLLIVLLLIAIPTAAVSARQLWVVQFRTHFPLDALSPCQTIFYWQSHLMLSNTADQPLSVSLLSVSNGNRRSDAHDLTISPHHTTSLQGYAPGGPNWQPDVPETSPAIWVNELEVPDGVALSDRGEVFLDEPIGGVTPPCSPGSTEFAGLTFKVVERLTPAGVSQYHLGADIGDAAAAGAPRLDARVNVGVFNAAGVRANATVLVRCSSTSPLQNAQDPLVATLQLSIPPNTLVQQTALPSTVAAGCPLAGPSPYHVVVTSDQPGFSYAASLSNQSLPKFPGFSPSTN
jgi:hypothetical protein